MAQPTLFSAELAPPAMADLGGLLAAHGQMTSGPSGARLSVLVADPWRADAVRAECARRGLAAEVRDPSTDGRRDALLVRSERSQRLCELAECWTRGAIKAVPAVLVVDAGLLRLWALAAGRADRRGYVLGLDPHARGTHPALAAALAGAGLAGSVVGGSSGWPGLRLSGKGRIARLAEWIGPPPDGAPEDAWPATGR